jgi:hypothetical protein
VLHHARELWRRTSIGLRVRPGGSPVARAADARWLPVDRVTPQLDTDVMFSIGHRPWHDSVMHAESRHLSVYIDRPMTEVYAFASNPANLPRWAPGLGSSVVREKQNWFVETPQGRVQVMFAPDNEYGVLDHEVVTPSGDTVYVPLRAVAHGDGCEVVFTLRRSPGMTDAEFERDTALVTADLELLKRILEGAPA